MGTAATAWRSLAWWVLAIAIMAGSAGVGLSFAGIHSPVRAPLVLLFLAVVPTTAIYGLLRSFDRFPRIILACTTNVVFLTLTAFVMLVEGVWSPNRGLLAVAGISLACLACSDRRSDSGVEQGHPRGERDLGQVSQTNAADREAE